MQFTVYSSAMGKTTCLLMYIARAKLENNLHAYSICQDIITDKLYIYIYTHTHTHSHTHIHTYTNTNGERKKIRDRERRGGEKKEKG